MRLVKMLFLMFLLIGLVSFSYADISASNQKTEGALSTTHSFNSTGFIPVETNLATPVLKDISCLLVPEELVNNPVASFISSELDQWLLRQSVETTLSIPPGEHFALHLDLQQGEMAGTKSWDELSETFIEAIERAPSWLRNDLTDHFRLYSEFEFVGEQLADMILDAEDPYVDELAFIAAHLSPDLFIFNMNWDVDLFVENVEGVYEADEYLDYVEIIDYGSADEGGDYWSTTSYTMCDEEGDTITVEIDREYYYWHIVHPRISDEIPKYINPLTGDPDDPPEGKFWRDFFLNEPEEGFTSLADTLDGCEIMYGFVQNDNSDVNGAIGRVTRWVHHVLDFDSGPERPIQPVRIYGLHMGRCGEHQDFTAAAARAALIPTVCTSSFTEDHVWNEFWNGTEWTAWEPVNNYINHPLAYQGWGKQFPALFDWRGDGFLWTVTERYHTETTSFTVEVLDTNDHPVDGVRVRMYSDYLYGGVKFATCGWTDSNGLVEFIIGGNKNIYLNLASEMGNYPEGDGEVTLVIEDSDTEVEYEWTYNFNYEVPLLTKEEAEPVENPVDHYMLHLSGNTLNEATEGIMFSYSNFVAELGIASVDYFVCDETNYNLFTTGEPFEYMVTGTMSGDIDSEIILPDDRTWYVVFDNTEKLVNYQRLVINADLLIDQEFDVDDEEGVIPGSYTLYSNYPNPFNSSTNIRFDIAQAGNTEITVYDILGQEVFRQEFSELHAGSYNVPFEFNNLSSGVYFYTLKSGEFSATQKMVFMK